MRSEASQEWAEEGGPGEEVEAVSTDKAVVKLGCGEREGNGAMTGKRMFTRSSISSVISGSQRARLFAGETHLVETRVSFARAGGGGSGAKSLSGERALTQSRGEGLALMGGRSWEPGEHRCKADGGRKGALI